jgi:5-formyltetrahydrofolate cyclo-ligase
MLQIATARTRASGGVFHVSESDEGRQFASSPCYMHELGNDWERVKAWRSERRKGLLKQRLGVDADTRRDLNRLIVTQLAELLDARAYPVLGFYWPIRGEIDVREAIAGCGKAALPVIVTKHAPGEFWGGTPAWLRAWRARHSVPRERRILIPDVLIIPLSASTART